MKIGISEVLTASGSPRIKLIKLVDLFVGGLLVRLVPAKRSAAAAAVKKILIIRPGGMGDAVFVIPFIKRLKQTYPGIIVDILCEGRNTSMFASQNELIARLYTYDSVGSFLKALNSRYDIVVDTEQWHYLSALVAYFIKSDVKIGFASRPFRAKLFTHQIPYDFNEYELDSLQKLFRPLLPEIGATVALERSFEVTEEDAYWSQGRIQENSVALFLGGSLPQKRLNLEQHARLIKFLLDKGRVPVLVGGHDYEEFSRQAEGAVKDARVLNLVGKLSLRQTAAVIQRSKLFIGTDSGLLHLACALGKPTVSVFGSSNRKKWGPRGPQHVVLSDDLACSPCTHFSYSLPTCNGRFDCMNAFKTEKIEQAVAGLLKN